MSRKIMRCNWCLKDPIYIKYHDTEWGVPLFNDVKIFESLILETFQAGLSWITVLKKRENFRIAFDNFNIQKIASYTDKELKDLSNDTRIIRNRLKIEAVRINAIAFMQVQKEFGSFNKYIWDFTNRKPIKNRFKKMKEVPANIPLSDKISTDLKRRGFKFIGSTIVYAHMQAIGMVNDHLTGCFRYKQINSLF